MKPTLSIAIVAGARPNFMKIAPIVRALQARKTDAAASGVDLCVSIVHSGKHILRKVSEVLFRKLAIPKKNHHEAQQCKIRPVDHGFEINSQSILRGNHCFQ